MNPRVAADDDRREVAARLRQMSDAHDATEASRVDRAIGLEDKAYGTVIAFDSADIRSLADLIDPTCEMVVKYGHACCGRCGHVLAGEGEVEEGYYEFRPFCPDCGARVVRDDDQ